jgi:hypothetical protein
MSFLIAYAFGLLVTGAAGFLFVRWLAAGRMNLVLHVLLACVFGLGMDGMAAFGTHILLAQSSRFLPLVMVLAVMAVLGLVLFVFPPAPSPERHGTHRPALNKYFWALAAICIVAVPLTVSALQYPLGGWDAWSCWNLKAKFIFLGRENWKDMLSPGLWRSNTHYPLLWPLINVWFCDAAGKFEQAIPMLNSLLIALLTSCVLLFGLAELTGNFLASLAAAVTVAALPFGVVLYTSQYSDSLMGLFLLSAFACFLLAEKYGLPRMKILSVILLGFMAFTKNEGLAAACIAGFAMFWHERRHKKELKLMILAFVIALLPTMIFSLFYAPKNEAFINGLTSAQKPAGWARLHVILVYPWYEFISGKWNGFWLLVFGGACLAGKNLWRSSLGMMGLSLVLYLATVMAYYAVNTFFEITWWLSTTLSRILFTLQPAIVLWIGLGLLKPNLKAA